jgi:dCMP deaminase
MLNNISEKWDRHFIHLALLHAEMSKDPSTIVGSVIVAPDREILSMGFNGFPRGILDSPERLNDRETKYKIVVHAEMNAILAAARNGIRLKDSTLYVAAVTRHGNLWGRPPCSRCLVEILQAGITEIISIPQVVVPIRWEEDNDLSYKLIKESGIKYREVKY